MRILDHSQSCGVLNTLNMKSLIDKESEHTIHFSFTVSIKLSPKPIEHLPLPQGMSGVSDRKAHLSKEGSQTNILK